MRAARAVDGIVVEVVDLPDGVALADTFPAALGFKFCPAAVEQGWSFDGESYSAPPAASPPTVDELRKRAELRRWQRETGGIVFGGVPIATDDRSKLMLAGARIKAVADENYETTWYGPDGSATVLDASLIVAISDSVLDHVDAVFTLFGAVLADIATGAIATLEQVDAAFTP